MKVIRLFFIIIFAFLFTTFWGCTKAIDISKESSLAKDTLFLVHSKIGDDIGLSDVFFKEMRRMDYEVQDLTSAQARIEDEEKKGFYGSGFFISEDGLFVTAYHVIEQAETIILRKIDGESCWATVLIEDPLNDIAILSAIGGQKESYWLSLENSHKSSIGDKITVLGYPVPELVGAGPKFSAGIISSDFGIGGDPTRFEIRAPLEPGCSGAAILNAYNEVIGIASEQTNEEWLLMTRAGPLPADISFGVKIEYARFLLEMCLDQIPRKGPNFNGLEDVINSTALVLINTQSVPEDFQPRKWNRIILVGFSRLYFCYVIQYTIFEFNKKWNDNVTGEVLTSGYIAGTPVSSPIEIVEAFIKEMRAKRVL